MGASFPKTGKPPKVGDFSHRKKLALEQSNTFLQR